MWTTNKPTGPEFQKGRLSGTTGLGGNVDPHDFVVHPSSGHPIFYAIPKARMTGLVPWTPVAPIPDIPLTDQNSSVVGVFGSSALDTQVGGAHYKDMAIQPIEFCTRNGIGYAEGLAIKYICRHERKNGAEDLDKAIHCLQILKEMKYGRKV